MDFRQLAYFLCLYEEGSMTRAARRLNIVQPALSMQLARLEAELGQQLFIRIPQGLSPTADGHRAYELFAPVLRDLGEARQRLTDRTSTIRGRIATGLIASVASSVLARALAGFVERHKEVEVTVFEGYSGTLLDWVRAGLLDFAVLNGTPEAADLQASPMLDEPFALIGAAEAPVPQQPGLADLRRLRLVLPSRRHGLRGIIDRAVQRDGLVLPIALELDSLNAIEQFVQQPGWFTVLPPMALHRGLRAGALRAHALAMPRLQRQVVCVSRQRNPPGAAGRRFVEMLEAELHEEAATLARGIVPAAACAPPEAKDSPRPRAASRRRGRPHAAGGA